MHATGVVFLCDAEKGIDIMYVSVEDTYKWHNAYIHTCAWAEKSATLSQRETANKKTPHPPGSMQRLKGLSFKFIHKLVPKNEAYI